MRLFKMRQLKKEREKQTKKNCITPKHPVNEGLKSNLNIFFHGKRLQADERHKQKIKNKSQNM